MELSNSDGSWVSEELSRTSFSDLRLDKRFQILSEQLAKKPSQTINHASTDWAAAKAAYRFFDNSKVTPEKILEGHFKNTELRLKSHKRVVFIQDTTVLDFSKHFATEGLGPIAQSRSGMDLEGLLMHPTMAFTEKGLPLGLIKNRIWVREHEKKTRSHERTKVPLNDRESFKWTEGLEVAKKFSENQEVIMVCDREGDIYEFIEKAQSYSVGLIVRLQHDRITIDEFDERPIMERLGVEKYAATPVQVEVPSSGKRKARTAELSVRFIDVTLSAYPRGIKTARVKKREDLNVCVVELHELHPPKGEEPLVWYLLTTIDVKNRTQALEVMHFYKMRWKIEQYFKTLKTGCNVESCRMNTGDKLKNFVSLQCVIAWRILWMTFLKRTDPNLSCEVALTTSEWQALWIQKNKRAIKAGKMKAEPPDKPPALGDAIRWIAMQGGFLGRKGDGAPGLITIWRGWLRLEGAAEMYDMLKN
jgi:hypothetical protein